jgi:nitroreductase
MLLLAVALVAVSVRLASLSTSDDAKADSDNGGTDALECIMTRTSIRSYTDRQVDDSTVNKILRAGMAAPTAANAQPWYLEVVTEQNLKDSIASAFEYAKMVQGCSFAVVVCGDMDHLFKSDKADGGFWVQDCSAVSENMLLAAHALGVGGVWCGIYPMKEREDRLRAILGLPDNLIPLNVMAFGYPSAEGEPKQKWDPAKVHYNAF